MSSLGKKFTAEQYGTALRMSYAYVCKDWRLELTEKAHLGLNWPENLPYEIGALTYFAFELGISSNIKSMADRIMDSFFAVSPPPPVIAQLFTERSLEYKSAIQSSLTPDQEMINLGNVFAKHTGHDRDPMVAMIAAAHFQNTLKFIADQAEEILPKIR